MIIDGALYRAGLKGVGGYARFTTGEQALAAEKERRMDSLKIKRFEVFKQVVQNLPEQLRPNEANQLTRAIAEQVNYATASPEFVGGDEEMQRKLDALVAELRRNGADQAASELISAVKMRPHYLAVADLTSR
jgi:hypothetical protein